MSSRRLEPIHQDEAKRVLTPAMLVLLAAMAVGSCVISLHVTQRTPLFVPDSAAYLSAAQNLVSGKGITTGFNTATSRYHPAQAAAIYGHVPLAQYGPLYPIILALAHDLRVSVNNGVRTVGVVTLVSFIGLVGVLAARMLNHRLSLVMVMVLLCVAAPGLTLFGRWVNPLGLSTFALSDLLFYVLVLASLVAVEAWLRTPNLGHVAAVVLLIAGATLTRYAGVSLAAVAALAALCEESWAPRRRLLNAGVAAGSGLVAFVGWDLVNETVFGATSPRTVVFHPDSQLASQMLHIAGPWFFPSGWSVGLTSWGAIVIVTGVLILCLWGPARDRVSKPTSETLEPPFRCWRIGGLFVVCYAGLLVITRTWLDASLAIDNRILGPLQIVLYLLIASLLYWAVRSRLSTGASGLWAIGAVVIASCLVWIPNAASLSSELTLVAPTAKTDMAVRTIPPSRFIITDDAPGLYLYYGHKSILLPFRRYYTTNQVNRDFHRDLQEVGKLIRRKDGLVIVWPMFSPSVATLVTELEQVSHLVIVEHLPDGGVILAGHRP